MSSIFDLIKPIVSLVRLYETLPRYEINTQA